LNVRAYPWKIIGMDFGTDLSKSFNFNFNSILIRICHLRKRTFFIPCRKEVTDEGIVDLFIDHCYGLHDVSRVIVSDKDSYIVSEFRQSFTMKLNTKLNMSTARYLQIDGLIIERVNEMMLILLRCYATESGFDWVSHLPTNEFCYNYSINEASQQSPFEVSYYGFKPSTLANKLLPLTSAPTIMASR
jgi:hypothetical protein